jgi:hypothetical protein
MTLPHNEELTLYKGGYMKASSTSEKTRTRLNSYLRSLSRRRNTGLVTSDDAHAFLTKEGVSSKKVRTRLSYINSVLRYPNFEAAGDVPSSRPVARGRRITAWVA